MNWQILNTDGCRRTVY